VKEASETGPAVGAPGIAARVIGLDITLVTYP